MSRTEVLARRGGAWAHGDPYSIPSETPPDAALTSYLPGSSPGARGDAPPGGARQDGASGAPEASMRSGSSSPIMLSSSEEEVECGATPQTLGAAATPRPAGALLSCRVGHCTLSFLAACLHRRRAWR